jgi:hypothetical protein
MAWSCCAISNSRQEIVSIIATGIDITEQRKAELRAVRAEESAARARQAVLEQQNAMATKTAPRGGSEATAGSEGQHTATDAMNSERRRRPRRSYPYRQQIAPVIDGKMPPPEAFVEIECHDIAAGGFSYLAAQPPASNSLIVALGAPPKLTHLSAEVAHVNRMKQDGRTMYLIGCMYTGRVQL